MRESTRWKGKKFLQLFTIVSCIVVVISYLSLHKLVFISKNMRIGKEKLIVFAQRVREKLIRELDAKPFICEAEDHTTLHGLVIEREKPRATLLLCHGYRCCKELTAAYVDMFSDCNTVLFDFRAHGENRRTITTIGCHEYKDVLAVTNWLKKQKPKLFEVPFLILGISMGGASALKATEKDPSICDGLIVDSSFSNLKSILYHAFTNKSGLPTFPFLYIMEKMFNYLGSCNIDSMIPLKAVEKLNKPLMLIHSCVDRLIPVQESLLMYAQAAKTGAKLWIAPQCKHGWLHKKYPELYKRKIYKFMEKNIFAQNS